MKAYTLMVLFATQGLLCGTGYSTENQYNKDITVRLEKTGETVQGEPIVVTKDQAGNLYRKDVHLIPVNYAGPDVWECKLKKGESYVIGWRAAKGWFKKKLIGYCSAPFTANKDGQRVSFGPGLPATFEYDLSKLPKYVKKFPAKVILRKIGVNGEHDYILRLSVTAKRPGIVRIKDLAAGIYYLEATNILKRQHRHEPFLYDRRKIRIESGKRCRFDPIIPVLDTTVDPGDVTIRGKVIDILGKPLVNREVILVVRDKDGGSQRELFYEIMKTKSSGGFVFKGVIPNRDVSVHCSGESRLLTNNSLPEHADVSVNIVVGRKRIKCLPGEAFLPLVLVDKDGKTIKIEDFKGKVVVYDFWATWCLPCIRNMPKINALAEEIGSDDVMFMTVSQDTDINVWKKKLADEKWDALSHGFLDLTQNEYDYEMPGIPFYIVVDKNGIIRAAGNRSSPDLRNEIKNIVRTYNKKKTVK